MYMKMISISHVLAQEKVCDVKKARIKYKGKVLHPLLFLILKHG
jgi:hypothetical protein